jgi:toxin YoeB
MEIVISPRAIEDMRNFKYGNQNLAFKVLELIQDISKNNLTAIGKPEPLKGNNQGYWSRRISDEHRIIYRIFDNKIEIISASGHYNNK